MLGREILTAWWIVPLMMTTIGCSSGRQFVQSMPGLSPHRQQLAVAHSYEHAGDLAKAEQIYREILARDPNSSVVQRRLDAVVKVDQRRQIIAARGPHSDPAVPPSPEPSDTVVVSNPPPAESGLPALSANRQAALSVYLAEPDDDATYGESPVPAPLPLQLPSLHVAKNELARDLPPSPTQGSTPSANAPENRLPILLETPQPVVTQVGSEAKEESDELLIFERPIIRKSTTN